jgi:thymidylate synthase (FAD)
VIEVKAPIFVFREWHRHRTQSYNEMSARYVPLPDENYMPTFDRVALGASTAAGNRQAQGLAPFDYGGVAIFLKDLDALYRAAQGVYERALAAGVPKELARLPVPVARYSRMRASANLRNWLAFLTLRMAPNAQWEIRQYANAVGELVAANFPRTWSLFSAGK